MAITAAASLKLDKVLHLALRAFERRLMPIQVFSRKFEAQEVPKDKQLQVPFVPLETATSTDWNPATGYGDGNFNIQSIPVPVNKRKFQTLSWNSGDLLGLPVDVLAEAMIQKTDKLASDVIDDICSVITAANYGAPIMPAMAASAFTTDEVQDIATALNTAKWPRVGRSLILDDLYAGEVLKDPALKNAAASGSTAALREGSIGRLSGFDIYDAPVPENEEFLVGFAALPSAVLIAAAPVEPEEEVRRQLSDYRRITSPTTGLTLVYRAWGSADFDKAKRVVEFSYGYAKGDTAQLKRIVKPDPDEE